MAPITLITAPPTYITREQLDQFQSTTPASGDFTHDPVLHHLEKDARITLEPALDGFEVDNTTTGDIYVTEGSLTFFIPSTSRGFSVPYPTLSLHAISRQPLASAGHPAAALATNGDSGLNNTNAPEQTCIYCQLDENEGADYDNLPEEELLETKEFCIFPNDPAAVQTIYSALSKCAALHPSTDSTAPGGLGNFADAAEGEDDFSELLRRANEQDGDGAEQDLTPAGRAQLQRLESLITYAQPGHAAQVTTNDDSTADALEDDAIGAANVGDKRKR